MAVVSEVALIEAQVDLAEASVVVLAEAEAVATASVVVHQAVEALEEAGSFRPI